MRPTRPARASAHEIAQLLPALQRLVSELEVTRVTRSRSEAMKAFHAELRRRSCGAQYVREATRFLERCLPSKALDAIGAADMTAALAAIVGAVSRERAQGVLNVFFAWLVSQGDLGSNPMAAIARQRKKPVWIKRRGFSPEEFQKLMRAPVKRYRRVWYAVAIGTGLRCGRLKAMTWGDVDLAGAFVRYVTKKGDEYRLKPLPSLAVEELRAWYEENSRPGASVLVFKKTPRIETFYADLKAAGIEVVTAAGRLDRHALRVSMCTAIQQAGVPLPVAQGAMDHVDVRVTAGIYSRFPDASQREAMERASKFLQGPVVKDQEAA